MRTHTVLVVLALSASMSTSSTAHAGWLTSKIAARFGVRADKAKSERPAWLQDGGASSAIFRALGTHPRLDQAVVLEEVRDRMFQARVLFYPSLSKLLVGEPHTKSYAPGIEVLRATQIERMTEEGFQSWSVFESQRVRAVARLGAPIAAKVPGALHDGMLALITEYLKYAGQSRLSSHMAEIDYADFIPMMTKLLDSPEARLAAPPDKQTTKRLLQRFYRALVEYQREGGSIEHWNGSAGMDISRLASHDALN